MREEKKKHDWVDLLFKAMTPLFAGLLIAWAGYVSNMTLSSVESKKENARLITELQVKREQAESDLRKDIFNQALKTLLKEDTGKGDLRSQSKRMLRLELLALNFGDSLSLSPLFAEFKNDLDQAEPVNGKDAIDHPERVAVLQKRLRSLAKKVAGAQLSSLEQHGASIKVRVPLKGISSSASCGHRFYDKEVYKWPEDAVKAQLADFKDDEAYQGLLDEMIAKQSIVTVEKVSHKLTLTFSAVDHCSKTVEVDFDIERVGGSKKSNKPNLLLASTKGKYKMMRGFRLDFFNFPKVDNTRLSDNQRFAIVMEDFNLKNEDPHIEVTGVIFPAEYASLRDRPGMREALQLLQSALNTEQNMDDSEGE